MLTCQRLTTSCALCSLPQVPPNPSFYATFWLYVQTYMPVIYIMLAAYPQERFMNTVVIIGLVNLFCAGILAGEEFIIHYGFREPAETLDEQSQLKLRQALILRLRVLVPVFFVPAVVSGIALT